MDARAGALGLGLDQHALQRLERGAASERRQEQAIGAQRPPDLGKGAGQIAMPSVFLSRLMFL